MLKYIKENDIKSFYPVYEAAEKANCIKTSVDKDGLTSDDITNIFDEIRRCNYPKCLEVYNILRKQKIKELGKTPSTAKKLELTDDLTMR